MTGHWTVYTDGASRGNPGPAAFGVVVLHPERGTIENSGFIGRATNQVAELTAALKGLEATPEGADVLLLSDSEYTLKGMTDWRGGWERNGYRTSGGKPVANLEHWKMIWAAADKRRVRTQWVKGHNGDRYNEQCDRLANQALDKAAEGSAGFIQAGAPVRQQPPAAQLQGEPIKPAQVAQKIAAPGTYWTPLSKGSPEPENVMVLYGLVEKGVLVRVESGVRKGIMSGKVWGTHWMYPAPLPGKD